MDLDDIKETDVWQLYQKSVNFMQRRNIYTDTDINYRFYNGDQWYGLKVSGVEKIQYNFIKQIVNSKTGTITSNLFAVNYSPENIENKEFFEVAQKSCELLNKKASKVWDMDFMDKKVKRWAKQSAINDEAVCYVTYDFDKDSPVNEIISKNDVMYGDENEEEIQWQPYILIRQRKTVVELREFAKKEGLKQEEIKNIVGDNDTSTNAGDSAKDELEDKAWLVTMLYKENGTVHFSQSTRYCTIKEDKDTGLTLYPVAHFNWEDQEGNARGIGEVRQLIPNQIETNKTAMRRAISVKNTAYPQKVVNVDAIQNMDAVTKVGATIKFKDMGNTRASDVFMNTTPAQMSTDSEKLQNELINISKDLSNASAATTGNIDPESASGRAILAVQNAQKEPLNDQVISLKAFIEDIARIWFEMWRVYAQEGLVIEVENVDGVTGEVSAELTTIPSYILEALQTSVKVDITPRGAFDKYAQELSLENLLQAGQISFEEYVDSLDTDSVMPKVKLENILKNRRDKEAQINQIEMKSEMMKQQAQSRLNDASEINNIDQTGQAMINQATAM